MSISQKVISDYSSPFTDVTYDIQYMITPQNIAKLNMFYDMTPETMNFIIQNNLHLVHILSNAHEIIKSMFENKPKLIIHHDYENGDKNLFIHINSGIKDHQKRFESKMKLCEKLYNHNKNYNKYFTITFD